MPESLYNILGVKPSSSSYQLAKNFIRKVHHLSRVEHQNDDQLVLLHHAFFVLSSDAKESYDSMLKIIRAKGQKEWDLHRNKSHHLNKIDNAKELGASFAKTE